MVKPDIKHDYYRDLDLPPTASIDDIKKQYRRLALLYHPDRNAGKEEEYVPRFQAIQTAHEVLGDAAIKNKYDADRRKAGMSFRPTTFGNPYAASAAYPPPPRRTQPGQWQRPPPFSAASGTAGGGTPTGAERFSNFTARPAPTARKDAAQDRTNMFKAWQNMNSAQDRQQRATAAGAAPPPAQPSPNRPRPPPPPRAEAKMPSEEEIRAGMNYRRAPPPKPGGCDEFEARRSAWASFQQNAAAKPGVNRSKTMKTPKKQGFDPNAPGSDERPAASGGYSHRHRSEDFGRSKNNSAFPGPPPGPPPQSPLTPGASPTSQQRPFADPLRPFKSRVDDDLSESQVPFAEGNRTRTPYSSLGGEKTSFNRDPVEGLRRSASTRDATKLSSNGSDSGRARSTSPLGRNTSANHPEHAHCSYAGINSSESDDVPIEMAGKPTSGDQQPRTGPSQRPKKTPTPPSRRFNGSTNPHHVPPSDGTQSDTEGARPSTQQNSSSNNIFSFPYQQGMFTPSGTGKSRSEENVNTNFSPNGWNGAFTGSADYFSQPPHTASDKKTSSPSRSQQKNGMRSATTPNPTMTANGAADIPAPPTASGMDNDPQADPSTAGEVRFSKEQWEKTFQDASWTYPTPRPPSPTKGTNMKARGRKPGKAGSKHFAVGTDTKQPPFVADEDGGAGKEAENGNFVLDEDADAMDIDSTPPSTTAPANPVGPQQPTPNQAESTKSPPTYPVNSSTWQQQQQQQGQEQQQQQSTQTNAHQRRSLDRASTKDYLNVNLDDLANVPPFKKSTPETGDGSGLKDFADLNSSLPFPSAASKIPPTQTFKPEKLQIPSIPKPPSLPQRLTKESWNVYARNFGSYLIAYHNFNNTMLRHFVTREEHVQKHYLAGGMSWLEASGDLASAQPGQPRGFGSYMQGVREDEQAREAWNLGCERHQEAVIGFEKMRERLRNISLKGGLVDR